MSKKVGMQKTSANPHVPGKLPAYFVLGGHTLHATGIWEGASATDGSWPGLVGPTMTQNGPTGLGTNLPPTVGQSTIYHGHTTGVQFNDGYAFGVNSDTSFANPGEVDLIAEVVFKASTNSALFGKYDNAIGGWLIWERSTGVLRFSNERNGYSPATVLTDGTWHHALAVSIRSSNTDGYIFLDGGPDGYHRALIDGSNHTDTADTAVPLCIGQEDTDDTGNTSTANVARCTLFVGSFGFTPTRQQMMDFAAARFAMLREL